MKLYRSKIHLTLDIIFEVCKWKSYVQILEHIFTHIHEVKLVFTSVEKNPFIGKIMINNNPIGIIEISKVHFVL